MEEITAPDTVAPPERPEPAAGPARESGEVPLKSSVDARPACPTSDPALKALVEAIVYATDEPVTAKQIAAGINRALQEVEAVLAELVADYARPERGLCIREIAGGYQLSTKAEHHEGIRAFAKSQKPPLKLSLPALETLAVIAYKQPITAPEIQEIRGVQGAGVLKTLLDRKLITTAGRKAVIGKPILYKTTREFLVQFGLKDLSELPTLKEFEELRRLALEDEPAPGDPAAVGAAVDSPGAGGEASEAGGPQGLAAVSVCDSTPLEVGTEPVGAPPDPSHA